MRFSFEWLVSLLRENLPRELDFTLEAANAEECRGRLQAKASCFRLSLPSQFSLETLLFRSIAAAAGGCLDSKRKATLSSHPSPVESSFSEETATSSSLKQSLRVDASSRPKKLDDVFGEYEVELHVPAVYRHLTTPRVLVMERCTGVCVDDREGLLRKGILVL